MTAEPEQPVTIKATEPERDAWQVAADACHMSRHAWARAVLNAAAGEILLARQLSKVKPRK